MSICGVQVVYICFSFYTNNNVNYLNYRYSIYIEWPESWSPFALVNVVRSFLYPPHLLLPYSFANAFCMWSFAERNQMMWAPLSRISVYQHPLPLSHLSDIGISHCTRRCEGSPQPRNQRRRARLLIEEPSNGDAIFSRNSSSRNNNDTTNG